MKQSKKKAELSINVVVMAVVALLVLVVLAIILIRNMGKGETTATQCANAGGSCLDSCEGMIPYPIGDAGCNDAKCCVPKNTPLG
jgi:hypothetical protein